MTEADTCRKYVLPKLMAAGWDNEPHSFTEQKTFTDGRIVVAGNLAHRRRQKRADYWLRYTRYQTKDFERVVALRARTEAIARHLTEFLKKTDRFAKTIVFCVDQEHADEMRRAKKDFFERYGPEAEVILNELLDKYAEHGTAQFVIPDVLKVPPISERGNVIEIASLFGGAEKLRNAINELQTLLYAA
jgi:type I site-specific restriction endonuclease